MPPELLNPNRHPSGRPVPIPVSRRPHAAKRRVALALALVLSVALSPFGLAAPVIDGVTFAVEKGKIYVPLDEAAQLLRWSPKHDAEREQVTLNQRTFPYRSLRRLTDGTLLMTLADLEAAGTLVTRDPGGQSANIGKKNRYFTVAVGPQRAEVRLGKQRLLAWQGERLVLDSRISSGRRGSTPSGNFTAGPYKARRHYSSRYDNAPMPWSVQVTGHVFIHGFTSVPKYPASHGCIRVPLNEGNPAKFFYEWIEKGSPIRVTRK